jgi:hypothetical protein
MIDYQYSYFVGSLIFVAAWVVFYFVSKTHRRQMIWGSVLSAPFALTGFLFIPEYWIPPSLFDLAARFGIGIEDVIWSAAVGGIASAASEILFRERLARMRSRDDAPRYAPLVLIVVLFVAMELVWPARSIYNMIIAFVAGALLIAHSRSDLIGRMLRGSLVFTAIYMVLFVYFLVLFPEFIERYYNLPNLLGIEVFGVPVEEIAFAFTGGTVWSVLYEYMERFKLTSLVPLRFSRTDP